MADPGLVVTVRWSDVGLLPRHLFWNALNHWLSPQIRPDVRSAIDPPGFQACRQLTTPGLRIVVVRVERSV